MMWFIPLMYLLVVIIHKLSDIRLIRWVRWLPSLVHLFVLGWMLSKGLFAYDAPLFILGLFALFVSSSTFLLDREIRYPELGAASSWVSFAIASLWVISSDMTITNVSLSWLHASSFSLVLGLSFSVSAVLWLWRLHIDDGKERVILFRFWRTLQLLSVLFLAIALGTRLLHHDTFEPLKEITLLAFCVMAVPLLFPFGEIEFPDKKRAGSILSTFIISWIWGEFSFVIGGLLLFFMMSL